MLLSELAADYFNLRELDAEIDVLNQGIVLQNKAFEFIDARHQLGASSGLDLAQQQSLLDASKTQLELLNTQRVQYEHAIATLTGTPAPSFKLAPAVVTLTPPALPVGLPSDVLQRRPDVASAERAVAAANAGIGIARAAYFPTVILSGSGGWDSNTASTPVQRAQHLVVAGRRADADAVRRRQDQRQRRYRQGSYTGAVASYRQSVLVAMQEVEDGVEGTGGAGPRQHARPTTPCNSSQRVLDLANDRYTGGVETYFDVITAQQTLLNNQRLAVQIRGKQMVDVGLSGQGAGRRLAAFDAGRWRVPAAVPPTVPASAAAPAPVTAGLGPHDDDVRHRKSRAAPRQPDRARGRRAARRDPAHPQVLRGARPGLAQPQRGPLPAI